MSSDRSSTWDRLTSRLGRERKGRRLSEDDAPADTGTARSRPTGGSSEPPTQDRNSSTGTTENEEFIGRASGDETDDTGPSGGEVREGRDGTEAEGALRDE